MSKVIEEVRDRIEKEIGTLGMCWWILSPDRIRGEVSKDGQAGRVYCKVRIERRIN